MGRPGVHVVAEWPVEHFVSCLLMLEAIEGARRYERRKQAALDALSSMR